MDKIVRIDVGAAGGPRASEERVGGYAGLGGRSMVSTVLWREVPPGCHPMGPANKLVLAPGLLAGSDAAQSGRLAMGCKSPLTSNLAGADTGGGAAAALGRLGYAAVIIEGRRVNADRWWIGIGPAGVTMERLDPYYKRMGAGRSAASSDATAVIRGDQGSDPGRPGHRDVHAVMGAKGIACLVIDPGEAGVRPPKEPERFEASRRLLAEGLRRYGLVDPSVAPCDGRHGDCPRCPGVATGDPGDGPGLAAMVTAAAQEDDAGCDIADSRVGTDAVADLLACPGLDPGAPDGRAEIARNLRTATAALDATGFCSHLALALLDAPGIFQALIDTIGAFTGLRLGGRDLLALGRDILRKEQAFNTKAGFGWAHDQLPWFFRSDSSAPRLPFTREPDPMPGSVATL